MKTQAFVNADAELVIGICNVSNTPMLYVQDGNRLEYFAKFTSERKAERFMDCLHKWDENGGNDGETLTS